MRLTLRTLLAYLDDMLEPAEARDMGAKVEESGVAQSLVARIKDVLRRRRLLAPDVEGPGMGVDPNIVAEYLDNAIPPNDVAEVEKIFLGSDIHLAEVAASHQILTLVLGDPVQVVPRSRERMYALGPLPHRAADGKGSTAPAQVAAIDVPVHSENGRSNGARPALKAVAPAAPLEAAPVAGESRIPEYLRPKPFWQRMLTPLVVLSLLGLFVWLLRDEFWKGGTPTASTGEQAAPATGKGETAKPATKPAIPPETAKPTEIASSVPIPGASPSDKVGPIDAPPPGEPTEVPLKPVDPNSIPEPTGTAPEKPEKPVTVPAPPSGTKPEVAATDPTKAVPLTPPPGKAGEPGDSVPLNAPNVVDAVNVEYSSTEGVLLRFDRKGAGWYLLPRRALVHAGEMIAAPEPFDSLLTIDKGAGTATLVGGTGTTGTLAGTAIRLMGPTDAALFGFDIRQGRMIVQTKKSGDEGPDELIFALKIGKAIWKVDLRGAGTVCAIEVLPKEPEGFEQNLGENTWTGRLYVTAGSAGVTDPTGLRLKLGPNTAIALAPQIGSGVAPPPLPASKLESEKSDAKKSDQKNESADAIPVAPPPGATESAAIVVSSPPPRWMDTAARTPVRRYAVQFEKNFDPASPIDKTLPALINDPTFQIADLAVRALALTQHYPTLVKALASSPHKESRSAAIVGLRTWLGASPDNGALLKEELSRNFEPKENVAILYELLWGYSPADARNPEKSVQLVDWLEHDLLAIRELAFYHLHRITGLKYDYDASLPAPRRTLAADRWRKHLKNEGGALLKK